LIEMRRTSLARFGRATHRSRAGIGPRPGMAPGSLDDRRGIRAILVGSALAGLLGATACAVASVSAWLAPAYLLLVVVILTAPRGQRVPSKAMGTTSELGESLADRGGSLPPHPVPLPSGARAIGWLLRAGLTIGRRRPISPSPHRGEGARRAGEGSGPPGIAGRPATRASAAPDPVVSTAESDDAVPGTLRVDSAANAIPKPRKGRARYRKTAKPADSSVPDSAPVTWVRVGPGQYVRSDAINQGQPPVEAPAPSEVPPPVEAPAPAGVQDVATHGDPVTDQSEPATAEPAAQSEVGPAAEVPEADAPASEEPATVAQPETDAPVAQVLRTSEGDATEALPTANDWPATEPSAPEVVPVAESAAEEHGIAPSAFGPMATEPDPPAEEYGIAPSAFNRTATEPESATEEYGIAPSAFGPTATEPLPLPLVLRPWSLVLGPQGESAGCTEDPGPQGGEAGASRPDAQHRTRDNRRRTNRSLTLRSAVREPRAMPSRRDVRVPGRPRACARGSLALTPRREVAARRAFGRRDHLRHAWRARPPPGSS